MSYLQGALGSDVGGATEMRQMMTHPTRFMVLKVYLRSAFAPNSLDSVSMVVGKTLAELLERWHHFLQCYCVCILLVF